jgi:PIN domain nuclease of toxin-antitoxin system
MNNRIWVSQLSIIEVAIKLKIGKIPDFVVSIPALLNQLVSDDFRLLALRNEHITAYDRIPFFEDHRDPFDRLILATALHEGWPVMSADRQFQRYAEFVPILW